MFPCCWVPSVSRLLNLYLQFSFLSYRHIYPAACFTSLPKIYWNVKFNLPYTKLIIWLIFPHCAGRSVIWPICASLFCLVKCICCCCWLVTQSYHMSDSLQTRGLQHARLPCPSPSSGACSSSCPLSRWCHPTISSSVVPVSSCLQSFPASGSFPVSQLFKSGGQSIGASVSASVPPMNIQDWLSLGLTSLISLQSKGLLRLFSNITVQKHQFLGTQTCLWSNSHIHIVQFSCSVTSDSLWRHGLQHTSSLSISNSQSLLKLMSVELAMPTNHLILSCPLLLLSSIFPSIRGFSSESVLCIR